MGFIIGLLIGAFVGVLYGGISRSAKVGDSQMTSTSKRPNCAGCRHSSIISTSKGIQVHCGVRCRPVILFDDCPIGRYKV